MGKKDNKKIIVNKNYICTNIYTTRIVEIFLELQKVQSVKNITEFCKIIGYSTSSWTLMSKGERGFPKKSYIENILVKNFNINPRFLDLGERPIFLNHQSKEESNIAYNFSNNSNSVISDSFDGYNYGKPKIPFLSIQEQANFNNDDSYLDSLTSTYNLYNQINPNSFIYEVNSDNMSPILKYGDIILIEAVNKLLWKDLTISNKIYIILSKGVFTIKRIKFNGLKDSKNLILEDNLNSQLSIPIEDIKLIWQAKSIVNSQL